MGWVDRGTCILMAAITFYDTLHKFFQLESLKLMASVLARSYFLFISQLLLEGQNIVSGSHLRNDLRRAYPTPNHYVEIEESYFNLHLVLLSGKSMILSLRLIAH